ncbi:MAG: DUF2147 domain-containing protein [Xanthobacteraceae bacterium]
MKPLFASAAILGLTTVGALGADASVIGDWLVKEGYGHVRIDNCGGKMWGIVSWEKTPGFDNESPDPAKKGRPLLGTPVLIDMAPTKEPGKWTGEVYNSQNGKNYNASISLADENTLNLEGCLVWPLCQTQQWTRVKTPPPNATPLPPLKSAPASQTKGPPATKGAAKGPAQPAVSDTCQRVAAEQAGVTPGGTAAKK